MLFYGSMTNMILKAIKHLVISYWNGLIYTLICIVLYYFTSFVYLYKEIIVSNRKNEFTKFVFFYSFNGQFSFSKMSYSILCFLIR